MARSPEHEHLYLAMENFIDRCLLNDNSLLWPDKQIWTLENLRIVRDRIIEEPDQDSKSSFEEKLQLQLKNTKDELWGLIADLYYAYFLTSVSITQEKKIRDIKWAAQEGSFDTSEPGNPVWNPLYQGFSSTGVRYHKKVIQFILILFFAIRIKQDEDPKHLLSNHRLVREMLDDILNELGEKGIDRAYDMRHALLYLIFPDKYEPIISERAKRNIVSSLKNQIDGTVPPDYDDAILLIREKMEAKYQTDGKPFYFHNISSVWDAGIRPGPERTAAVTINETEGIVTERDQDQFIVEMVLQNTKNVIIYGPPGTGKTYIARKVAEALVEEQLQQQMTEPASIARAIANLTFYDILALSMYVNGYQKRYSVPDLTRHRFIQARFATLPVKHPTNQLWGYLQSHADQNSTTVNYTQKTAPYLFDKDENSRWFLIEEGRKYVEENLAEPLALLKTQKSIKSSLEDYVRWVTFHQSYAYEDFVEGLRPVMAAEAQGDIAYEITPGIFREICGLAAQDPENQYVLIIDEINRGNIAKIFGELITLLEDDKRGNLSISLSYSKQNFTVPPNIYIIGTMNTADRSIALMDVALRRRFAFVEIMPRPDLLHEIIVESEGAEVNLGNLLRTLNTSISEEIDRDHQIGHSYFMRIGMEKPEDRSEMLDYVWNFQILPLLEEYYYSRRDKLEELLSQFRTEEYTETEGAAATEPIGRATGVDLIDALSRTVRE